MTKQIYLLVVILSTICAAYGQTGKISGVVQDANGPLGFASIMLNQQGFVADSNGTFEITYLEPGSYRIEFSYVGYKPKQFTKEVLANETTHLTVQLVSAGQLDEIVVSGTMKASYVSNSPVKIDVISSRQIEKFMPAAASSVVEGVQLINGVEEVVACGVCFTNSISVNGLPGQYTAILLDGMPVYGNLASVYGLNGIPAMIIDRYEVIKGPSSTLYGSEAVGGVINIITKDPSNEPLFAADIMGTSHGESFGSLAIAPKIGRSNGYIGMNYAYINDYEDANQDGFGDMAQLDRISLFTKWNIHRQSDKLFSIAAKVYLEDRRNGVEEFLADRAYKKLRGSSEVYGESIYTQRYELFGSYEIGLFDGLRADFSMSHHDQDSYYGSDHYTARQSIGFVNLIWNRQFGAHDITGGLTARYQVYDDNTIATEVPIDDEQVENRPDKQFIPGVYIQDEWTAGSKWTLLPGFRLDYYGDHGLIPAPRLSVKYDISDWTQVRANLGTGFRIVNLFTEDHAFVTGQREVIIEESLNPERSFSSALNLHHIYVLGNGSGTIDVDAHYTTFYNKITPDYSEPGKIVYRNSQGSARTMGVAATANYNFAFPLGIQLSANLQRTRQENLNDDGSLTKEDIEFAPKYTGLATINYQLRKAQLTFAYSARLTGPMRLPVVYDLDENGQTLPDARPTTSEVFAIHNLQITKGFGRSWRVYAGIQNIFDQRQQLSPLSGFNDPNTNPGFSDNFDTAYAYGNLHGREFYVGINWKLWRK